ncbi:MAG: TIGR01620 family protein [Hyphomicrobiaceae bacterium]|nr:MAG: TIGR01620 family protein [Hyphomicrobiaceae bacterium]
MSGAPEPRKPQVFEPDDPALVGEPVSEEMAGAAEAGAAPAGGEAQTVRPTLSELSERGLRWGSILVFALAGAAALGIAAWFARLVSAALVRDDWIGWSALALLLVAALAAVMVLLREIAGFARLSRLGRLKADIASALADRDQKRERKAARRLADLYAGRPELAWSLSRFREHTRDVHDPGELLALADRDIVAPLDQSAKRLVTRSAKRVATVTALSPAALIDVSFVLIENLRLLRALATLYGGRPGFLGLLRLARMVATHMVATGGIALTDDLLGQFLGQDLLRRLSRRLGEGAFNGALTARVGIAAIDVVRPLPFLAAKPPRVRDVLGEVLKPMFRASPREAARQ